MSNESPLTKAELMEALQGQSQRFDESLNGQRRELMEALQGQSQRFDEALNGQRREFHEALHELRQEFGEALNGLRQEVVEALHVQRQELVAEISRQTERVETRLLTEFHKYARRAEILRKRTDSNLESLGERVELIESRLDEIDDLRRKNAN